MADHVLNGVIASAARRSLSISASRSFDPLRSDPRFQAILAEAEVGRQQALAAFREAGGERLLGR
jgi:hypothetical protein